MGVMPVNQLLLSMSLPMMISMLVQALYNIVDSIFVSNINEEALQAVSLAFPLQSLMFAVAIGTAVGLNAFLSKTLGEKDFEKGKRYLHRVHELYCICVDRYFRQRAFLCQPDPDTVSQRVWCDLSDYLLCVQFWCVYTGGI